MTNNSLLSHRKEEPENGILYLVGTPIGNLNDISPRAINILKNVSFIACEDTRQTRKLMNKFLDTKLKKTILLMYEPGAGGDFLTSMLSMSDSIYGNGAQIEFINDGRIKARQNEKIGLQLFDTSLVFDDYEFYNKDLKKPIEVTGSAANSGYGKTADPEWVDQSAYIIYYKNKYFEVPKNHKKMIGLKVFNETDYTKFRKENKINLKKEEDLKQLITFFN